MRAELRFVDHQRAGRALIGWLDGDRLALDTVMQDAIEDDTPGATAGLVLGLVQLAAEVLVASVGSAEAAAGILRQSLVSITNDALEAGDDA